MTTESKVLSSNNPPQEDPLPYIVPKCTEQVKILYQDNDLLLINKPAFLLSVPGKHPLNKDCVITRLQEQFPTARIVHRLDLDTSGIMVIALSKDVHRELSRLFEQRLVSKTYTAVVYGEVNPAVGEVDLPLICDWPNRPKQKVCHDTGKNALTRYEVITFNEAMKTTRLLLKPLTGRSHQLRVHMQAIGHPILGCDFYAHEQALAMSPRLLLHATSLDFKHPITQANIQGHSPSEF